MIATKRTEETNIFVSDNVAKDSSQSTIKLYLAHSYYRNSISGTFNINENLLSITSISTEVLKSHIVRIMDTGLWKESLMSDYALTNVRTDSNLATVDSRKIGKQVLTSNQALKTSAFQYKTT